jgi:predicted transcriptional regulator
MGELARATGGDAGRELEKLPAEQQTALELLVSGKSVAETARLAGVGRATVFRWLKNDPEFGAAYNQWHEQLREGCQSRLMKLTEKATDALEKALEAGDARAALQLLKGMGMIKERKVGPTEPEEAERVLRMEQKKRKKRLNWEEMDVAMEL